MESMTALWRPTVHELGVSPGGLGDFALDAVDHILDVLVHEVELGLVRLELHESLQ